MHELSIAIEIIETSIKIATSNQASTIKEIEIDVGAISGVDYDALCVALDSAKLNSMAENANIKINKIFAKALCENCKKQFEIKEFEYFCPFCFSLNIDIITGKELKIKHIIIE